MDISYLYNGSNENENCKAEFAFTQNIKNSVFIKIKTFIYRPARPAAFFIPQNMVKYTLR